MVTFSTCIASCGTPPGALDGDPGDRIITAAALVEGATLVTNDARITESGVVSVVW